jgi:uncharacterized membrane protein
MLRSINLPMKLVVTYKRILLEDLPQLGIQLILFFYDSGFSTTSNLVTFVSSCLTIFMSLRETWNARPSTFDIKRFQRYIKFAAKKETREG